ncbi:hypothetical protein ACWIG4_29865 [Streptomyces sp. NPDC002248]
MPTLTLFILATGAAVSLLLVVGAGVAVWRLPALRAPLAAAGTVAAVLAAVLGAIVAAGHTPAPAPAPMPVRISVTTVPAP